MTPLPIHAVFSEALDVLETSQLQFAIMGGFAVRALGLPRPTYDGDLVVDADVDQSLDLFRRFEEAGFRVPDEFSKGYRDRLHGMEKVAIHKLEQRHDWRIDLFFPTTPLLKSAFARRKQLRFMGKERAVLTAEDIVLLKLLAGRTKDKLDIEELLKIHRSPDVAYLKLWAGRLDLTAELLEQLKAAGLQGA